MSAHNKDFPWMSYYGNYDFFERRMKAHSKVKKITKIDPSLFYIELTDDRILNTFVCECYSFGNAEYVEACSILGELNAVVINSNWCGYSLDVKYHCMNECVGIYDIGGFMAALNMCNYWKYLNEYEKDQFKDRGWNNN
jgi:hypothetical protein